jgi:hypothetical protein
LGYPTVLMKKTLAWLVVLAGLVPLPALAQSSIVSQIAGDAAATEKLYFSLKLGLNVSYLAGAEAGTERAGGFNIGLSATVRLTDRLSLGPEVTPFSRKGVSTIPFMPTGDPVLDAAFADPAGSGLVLQYTDVPVLVRYRLGRFHLGAGPCVSFLSSATERFRADLDDGRELRYKRDVSDRFKKTDLGLAFEASWTITRPRGGTGLVFHVRYMAGLADIRRPYTGPLDVLVPGSGRNSVLQAYLSFPFIK